MSDDEQRQGMARITDPGHLARAELVEQGRAVRKEVSRAALGDWTPSPDRPDPIAVLEESNRNRVPELVPIRYGRMLKSPFTFYRGAPAVMAWDLARMPSTGLNVQACGDAHLLNFGAYASPERRLVFDVNDFDETLPAPWEWDLKRLAASCAVAARTIGLTDQEEPAVQAAVRGYAGQITRLSGMTTLDIRYAHIDLDSLTALIPDRSARRSIERFTEKTKSHTVLDALSKLTEVVDGQRRIVERPPLIVRFDDLEDHIEVRNFFDGYAATLQDDRRHLLSHYRFVDAARKVVGVGSVGMRASIVLFEGRGALDPLFLQLKEAEASVLEPYAGSSTHENHGHRVVTGQRLMQATTDLFIGWSTFGGRDFYVRQLRDMKGSINLDRANGVTLTRYAYLCGGVLARAHARSVGPGLLHGYLGTGSAMSIAMVAFARAYADQNERDHAALVEAVRSGRLEANEEEI